jgi:Rne/Rng family ribonuclease
MVSELWLSRLGGQLWAAAVEDSRIVEIHNEWPQDGAATIGSVYLARVQRVVPQLQAAFVLLGRGEEAYLEGGDLRGDADPAAKLSRLGDGQSLLVQVRREAHAGKRARVTAKLELVGNTMTLRPAGSGVAVSRRIRDDAERDRLTRWAREQDGRVLLRTAAENVPETKLQDELDALTSRAARLTRCATTETAPARLESAGGVVERLIRDYSARALQRIVVETEKDLALAQEIAGAPVHVERHEGPGSLIQAAGIWRVAQQALKPRVSLPSGASLAIERTEALWAIDVNAAAVRHTGGNGAVSRTINCEAADLVADEIRLRDIAGTILIDFLTHAHAADRELVSERLSKALRGDRRYLRVSGWTSLGLCELARRRLGPGLLERLGPLGAPTPWALAAAILESITNGSTVPRGHLAVVDQRTALALSASVESSETPIDLEIEIEEGIVGGYRLEAR